VNGIGDINNDGYDDMMITSYSEWQGKVGSYLIVFPSKQQWISNIPSFLPSSSPSSMRPTSYPSEDDHPINLPSSVPSSFPSSSPSFRNTVTSSRSPTFLSSNRPSKPPTLFPSLFPTFIQTFKPSPVPSRLPTHTGTPSVIPSIFPTTLYPTKRPSLRPSSSAHPSFFPTSYPSLSASSQGRTVVITSGGDYAGGNGEENLVIASTKDVIIKGNQGKKHFIITSSVVNNITITILDFKEGDVLDFSQLTGVASVPFSYFYTTNPLTFVVKSPVDIRIILSSHSDYDLQAKNLMLPSSGSSLSSSASSSSSLSVSFGSLSTIYVVVPLLGLFALVAFLLNSRGGPVIRKHKEKEKDNEQSLSDDLNFTLSDEIDGLSFSNSSFAKSFFSNEISGDEDIFHPIIGERDVNVRNEDFYADNEPSVDEDFSFEDEMVDDDLYNDGMIDDDLHNDEMVVDDLHDDELMKSDETEHYNDHIK
jgi:hypothetical protein